MKNRYIALLVSLAAASGLSGICSASPSINFVPASPQVPSDAAPRAAGDRIQIMTNAPSENATILGELKIQGDSDTSLHDLVAAALEAAKAHNADFLAFVSAGAQPVVWVGKMVPAGHGRSMFVAGPVRDTEINRIASIPQWEGGSINLLVGRYARKAA